MRKLILATTLLAPATALAGGYIIPNENARDLALSSATVAASTGAEAIFSNTSDLAGTDGLQLAISGEILANRTTWTDPSGTVSASLIPHYNPPPSGAISFGKHINHDMAWGIGAGADVPGGGSEYWPNGWAGQEYIQSVHQQVFRIAVGGGLQLSKYLKIGAAYQRYQAVEELHQSLNYLDHYGDAALGLSGGANSFMLAIDIHVPKTPLTIAAQYSHSGAMDLSGNVHFTNVPPAFSPLIHDQDVTEALTVPKVFYVGASYAVQPNVKLMAAINWEGWGVYHQDKFVGSDGFSVAVARNYNEAHVYRGALEWNLAGFQKLTMRFGAVRGVSSQPKDTVSPTLTDGNSWAGSIGCGVNVVPALRVDFGYQHAIFDTVKATGTEALPGSYATHVDLFSLGINWHSDLGLKGK
jgi:long-chain fatty acid transport protein